MFETDNTSLKDPSDSGDSNIKNQSSLDINAKYKNDSNVLIKSLKEIIPPREKIITILSLMILICILIITINTGSNILNWTKNKIDLKNVDNNQATLEKFTNQDRNYAQESEYLIRDKSEIIESVIVKQIKTENKNLGYKMQGFIIPTFSENNLYSLMFSNIPITSNGNIIHTQSGNFDVITNTNLMGGINFDLNKLSDNIFFRLNSVPEEILNILGIRKEDIKPILNEWVYISDKKNLLQKKSTDSEKLNELALIIINSISLEKIKIENDNIDSEKIIKIKIEQDSNNFDDLIRNTNKWYLEETGSYIYFKDKNIKFSDVFEKLKADFWLDANDYSPKRVMLSGKYKPILDKDISSINFLNIKDFNFVIDIKFTENQQTSTNTPRNFQTYKEYINKINSVLTNIIIEGKRDSLFNQIINNYFMDEKGRKVISENQKLIDFVKILQAISRYESDCKDFPDSLDELIQSVKACNTKKSYFDNLNFNPLDQTAFYYQKYTDRKAFSLCVNFSEEQRKNFGYASSDPCPNPSFNTHFYLNRYPWNTSTLNN
ncbi:MAG: hypothetical protein N2558_01735 [Patescibacteria group bacterium]|nr:hypothetical protein [Patescibacteria group bacterium]